MEAGPRCGAAALKELLREAGALFLGGGKLDLQRRRRPIGDRRVAHDRVPRKRQPGDRSGVGADERIDVAEARQEVLGRIHIGSNPLLVVSIERSKPTRKPKAALPPALPSSGTSAPSAFRCVQTHFKEVGDIIEIPIESAAALEIVDGDDVWALAIARHTRL